MLKREKLKRSDGSVGFDWFVEILVNIKEKI